MKKEDIIIKNVDKDPLQNIEWHTSPIGITSNSCFRNAWHLIIILENIKSLHKIIDPTRYDKSVLYYKEKRDNAIPIQTKSFYHNIIRRMFESATNILYNMSDADATYYEFDKEYIKTILAEKEIEYEVDTYIAKIKPKK